MNPRAVHAVVALSCVTCGVVNAWSAPGVESQYGKNLGRSAASAWATDPINGSPVETSVIIRDESLRPGNLSALPSVVHDSVEWSEVRHALQLWICRSDHGQVELAAVSACGDVASARASVQQAARTALSEMRPLLENLIVVAKIGAEESETRKPALRGEGPGSVILSNPLFLAVLLPRLQKQLALEGLQCPDCPLPIFVSERRISWGEFAQYVTQFIFVEARAADEQGRPLAEPEYSFHICSTLSEIDAPPPFDALLGSLGLVVALELKEVVADALGAVLEGDPGVRATTPTSADLTRQVLARVRADHRAIATACNVFAQYADETQVEMAECNSNVE